jgi:virginiamycin B lyase
MKLSQIRSYAIYAVALALILPEAAHAQGFAFSTISFTGATNTAANGVNNTGQIVGGENANSGTMNGFLSTGGVYTTSGVTPGLSGGYAEGINNSGQIVGLNLANGTGFLRSGGSFTTIIVPGSDGGTTNAIGINDSGQIVGTFLQGGVQYGFELSGGVYTTINVPGATTTVACGINNNGQIVGWFTGSGATSGFSLSSGNYSTLSFPGSASTKAFGINNHGQIVGEYSEGGSGTSGFLLQRGSYASISVPSSSNTAAIGINDAGQIVGSYVSGGAVFGFSAAQNIVAVAINEYPVVENELGGVSVSAITSGSDGALWFAAMVRVGRGTGFEIWQITTAGVATAFGPVDQGLTVSEIAAGPDGALWFTFGGIGRVTTAGVITEYSPPTAAVGIASGPDGALWFTESNNTTGAGSAIGRITTSGVITEYPLPTPGTEPQGIVSGPDGALWFTETGKIGRITTSGTTITEYPLPNPGAGPQGIACGPDGALWFTDPSSSQIGQITTEGVITEYLVPGGPGQSIAPGPDGALWFKAGGSVGRITTAGAITEYPLPAGTAIGGITAGSDGAMWFTATEPELFQPPGGNYPVLMADQVVINPNGPPPVLSLTKTHAGTFTQGQTNATYTLTVSNQPAAGPSSGWVQVTDTLPSGLSLVSMAGPGWTCTSFGGWTPSFASCTRTDGIPGGAAFPPITVTVNVAANATSPQVNQATITGGESASASTSDSTIILPLSSPPLLSITKTHSGSFSQGQTNATYTVSVSNQSGAGPTAGVVTVTDTLPSGLSLVSMSGTGWNCAANSCTGSDSLPSGGTYPSITVTVNVAANASSPQVNLASVSGGGNASTVGIADSTTIITLPPVIPFFAGSTSGGGGTLYLQFPNGNIFGYYVFLSGGWLYHADLGYEYVSPGNGPEIYLWDLASGHWWYTNTSTFPYLYDFTFNAWLYFFPNPQSAGHYYTNPRWFANMTTGLVFTMD